MYREFGQGLASRYEVAGARIITNTKARGDIMGQSSPSPVTGHPQSQEDREVIVRLNSCLK